MAHFDRSTRSRYVRPGREAILPFAVGLLLIIAGAAAGFVVAAITGSLGARPAVAAPVAPAAASASIEAAAEAIPVCRAPDAVADGHPGDSDHKPAFTFGVLVFDWDAAHGSSMPGFAPLPATTCTLSRKSTDG
jgi:hypothetical protein